VLLYAVVENLRSLGCDVETYKWDSSEHVKHIVEHSDEYERLVLKFMAKLGLPLRGEGSNETPSLATKGGVASSDVSGQSVRQNRPVPKQRVPLIVEAPYARL
jgi:hypothetical protein